MPFCVVDLIIMDKVALNKNCLTTLYTYDARVSIGTLSKDTRDEISFTTVHRPKKKKKKVTMLGGRAHTRCPTIDHVVRMTLGHKQAHKITCPNANHQHPRSRTSSFKARTSCQNR